MDTAQPGILAPLPLQATYLSFVLKPGSNPRAVLQTLLPLVDGKHVVLGIGASLASALGGHIPGLREFSGVVGSKVALPQTPAAIWFWLRGDDIGALVHLSFRVQTRLAPAFVLQRSLNAFYYGGGRDLTGYEDGTENPRDRAAIDAAIVQGRGAGLDGSSFVAVQQWQHYFDKFHALSPQEQDHAVGRRRSDNEELEDAPDSAHVKRTAQEDFAPEAFSLRRSLPWSEQGKAGLQFVAFGKSFDAFEAQLTRMSGAEDGVVDALFGFSEPLTGSYFWCPPLLDDRIDLSVFGFD